MFYYYLHCKVLLIINVSFLTDIYQNFLYMFIDVFFDEESENDGKIYKKRLFKAKNSKNHIFFGFLDYNASQKLFLKFLT